LIGFGMKVLVIEDSQRLLRSLGQGLKREGYSVDLVADGREGWDFARLNDYDVIVLDLMLPGMDGLSILSKLRSTGKQTHVLILSAKDQVRDRVKGLQMGADDYLIKPFAFDELCARLNSLIRRRYGRKNPEVVLGTVAINRSTCQVLCNGEPVELTPGEYAIAECLALNRGRVMSKEQILDAVHDSDSCPGPSVVEVMVCTLRRKLRAKGASSVIKTRRGYGYYVE